MTTEEITTMAKAELVAIKKHATEPEWDTLRDGVDKLDGGQLENCIYGKMTGFCFSQRAYELVEKCSGGVFFNLLQDDAITVEIQGDGLIRNFTPLERILLHKLEVVQKWIKELE